MDRGVHIPLHLPLPVFWHLAERQDQMNLISRFRVIVAILALASLGLGAYACWRIVYGTPADYGDGEDGAKLALDHREWDFGVVARETSFLTHNIRITNSGSEAVSLRLESIGCGCLSVHVPEVLPAGDSAFVKLDLDLRSKEGSFSTYAILATSEPYTSRVELRVRVYVQPGINVDPPVLAFHDVKRGATLGKDLRVLMRSELAHKTDDTPLVWSEHSVMRVTSLGTDASLP